MTYRERKAAPFFNFQNIFRFLRILIILLIFDPILQTSAKESENIPAPPEKQINRKRY